MDRWHVLLLVGMTAGCGGNTNADARTGGVGTGGASTGGVGAGGAGVGGAGATAAGAAVAGANASGGLATGGAGQTGGSQTGGESSETGGGGGGDGCNETLLWFTVADAAISGLGTCGPSECMVGATPMGAVTFDSEGQAIDITGLDVESEQEWMQEVASERWLCLADQTVEYCCGPR